MDVLVFATGFDIKAPLGQFDITARGADLNATLEATPEAYLGTAVAGFPNLFTLLGLNTGARGLDEGDTQLSWTHKGTEHLS